MNVRTAGQARPLNGEHEGFRRVINSMTRGERDVWLWIVSAVTVIGVYAFAQNPDYYGHAAAAYVCDATGFNDAAAEHAEKARDAIRSEFNGCMIEFKNDERDEWTRYADACRAE